MSKEPPSIEILLQKQKERRGAAAKARVTQREYADSHVLLSMFLTKEERAKTCN